MSNINTVRRSLCTLGVVCLLATTAWGQSTLNFTPDSITGVGIAVTNATPYPADAKFTLFRPDGSSATIDVLNNPSFRIPPGGQLALTSEEIFRTKAGSASDGWIQASSSVTGLRGFYFSGDYRNTFDGGDSLSPASVQTIPYLRSGASVTTMVIVTNPGSQRADVSVAFFNAAGSSVHEESFSLPAYAQRILPAQGVAARILGSTGLLAIAWEKTATSLVSIAGQALDLQALKMVAPGFRNENETSSTLVLSNPLPTPVQASVSFFSDLGVQAFTPTQVSIPGNGSTTVLWSRIMTSPLNAGTGSLHVDSSAPLTGIVLIDSGGSRTAVPLQSKALDRMLFSRAWETAELNSRLTLVGNGERDAQVAIILSRPDGTAFASGTLSLRALGMRAGKLSDFVPLSAAFGAGFLTIQSSVPIFAAEVMNLAGGAATITPQRLPVVYSPVGGLAAPQIQVSSSGSLGPGTTITIDAKNHFSSELMLMIGGQVVPMSPAGPPSGRFNAVIPQQVDPGIIEVTLWSGSLKSNTVLLGVYSPDGVLSAESPSLNGQAFFQKLEVTDKGLEESQVSMVPIRNARVEIFDRLAQSLVSVTGTNDKGEFAAKVPIGRSLTVRIVSRSRFQDLEVLDNTDADKPYVISRDIDQIENVEIIDTTRVSGAFNILDVIQRANVVVSSAEPLHLLPPVKIYWSTRNTNRSGNVRDGQVETTFFDLATNSGYILGDRNTDSDEFDDSVILHEYAHMLATRFSKDDSSGRAHGIGDVLDPRVAWSEGFANFFSAAVLGNPIYRDSKGPAGNLGLRMDLEEDIPAGDYPGYWSEASVHGLLWDLVDENADGVDTAQVPFSTIWRAFTELKNGSPVYLPYFLEKFVDRNSSSADVLRALAVGRGIGFLPYVRPSVADPFPRPMLVGEQVTGELDSLSTKRTNLMKSMQLHSFNTVVGGRFLITLNIEGLGPANKPNANDLDIFLYDGNGKLLAKSDTGLSGQSELIPVTYFEPGTYFVEVRSFYRQAETNMFVFNSGRYRLSVQKY